MTKKAESCSSDILQASKNTARRFALLDCLALLRSVVNAIRSIRRYHEECSRTCSLLIHSCQSTQEGVLQIIPEKSCSNAKVLPADAVAISHIEAFSTPSTLVGLFDHI